MYPTLGTMEFIAEGPNEYYGYTPYTYPHPLRGGIRGDLNNDGVVNIQDVQLGVNVILGTETNPEIHGIQFINSDLRSRRPA